MLELPVDDADKFCGWMLTDFEHNHETVMMAPGSGFYATTGLGAKEARIAYVLRVEALKRSVEIIERALSAYPGRAGPSG
jgi:aspartate aminotransferase